MTTIKTAELTGAELDYAVGLAQGWITYPTDSIEQGGYWHMKPQEGVNGPRRRVDDWEPSSNWDHGGPIITREMIGTTPVSDAWWRAGHVDGADGFGPSPLVAAMRCYVKSVLGDTVEIPEAP